MIKESLKKLKTIPKENLVVGDSPEDIKAGKREKIKTVAILTGTQKKYQPILKTLQPDFTLESIIKLPEIIKS